MKLKFPSNLNIIAGENAQGKTSVLEAIHLLSLLTSPVAGHDRQMICFTAMEDEIPVGRVVAVIEKAEKTHTIEVRLIIGNGNGSSRLRKEVIFDGSKRKLLDAIGYFNSVIFLPQMTRIIEDGPDERRKYLDRTLSQAVPGYVRTLAVYNQGISSRNALLKQIFEQGGSRDQLVYWDQLIAENGAVITNTRLGAVHALNETMRTQHDKLTHGNEQITLSYLSSVLMGNGKLNQSGIDFAHIIDKDITVDVIKKKFLQSLIDRQEKEIQRGVSTIGPHRDDLRFIANNVDLGIYGSHGQIRTAVMALKFAELYWLKAQTGEAPVLLLDETLAELDHLRRQDLLDVLEENTQSILTTTDLQLFDQSFLEKCRIWNIHDGEIKEKN